MGGRPLKRLPRAVASITPQGGSYTITPVCGHTQKRKRSIPVPRVVWCTECEIAAGWRKRA
jgi:hypothetical protein